MGIYLPSLQDHPISPGINYLSLSTTSSGHICTPLQDHPISPSFKLGYKIFPSKILIGAQYTIARHSCLYTNFLFGHISTLSPGSSHQPRLQLAASVPSPQVGITVPPLQDHPISPGFKLLNKVFSTKILISAQHTIAIFSCICPTPSFGHISTLFPGSSHQPRHQLAAIVPPPQVGTYLPSLQDHPISPG